MCLTGTARYATEILPISPLHENGLTGCLANIPPANVSWRQLKDFNVCHDQSASGSSQRDLDKSKIRDKGKPLVKLPKRPHH